MNLNIGSSDPRGKYKRNWVNLDIKHYEGVGVLGSGLQLPFKDNSFETIHCVHVLEHVRRDKSAVMLEEIQRVLKPHHRAYIEVPDFERVIGNLWKAFDNDYKDDIHKWTTSIYGKNERPGMAHYWGFHEKLLEQKMKAAGFSWVVREEKMISEHYTQEPVLLMSGAKP